MNALDWVIVLIMFLSVVLAATQGFFFEVISLAGAILGYLLAAWNYGRIAPWFLQYVKQQAIADLAGFRKDCKPLLSPSVFRSTQGDFPWNTAISAVRASASPR